MKTAFLSILVFFTVFAQKKSTSHQQITRKFFKAVSQSGYNANELKDSYIIPLNDRSDSIKSVKRNEFVNFQLAGLHQLLKGKDVSKIAIYDYVSLPRKERNIDLESIQSDEKLYVVKYQEKYITSVLFHGDLIKSFCTMNKGGAKTFLVF